MNRRDVLKTLGLLGAGALLPSPFGRRALAALPPGLQFQAPAVRPTVINLFLYGGPSELAGNLTNMAEIAQASQNPYPSWLDPADAATAVTRNGFWGPDGNGNNSAGGEVMEALIASGDLSVYRTVNRVKDDNKAHGRSVLQNLAGNLDPASPGFASTLCAVLAAQGALGKPLDELVLPVVSFEGESPVFNLGTLDVPLALRPMSLDADFQNPYSRSSNSYLDAAADAALEALAAQVAAGATGPQLKVRQALERRSALDAFIAANFDAARVDAALPVDPATTLPIAYPDTGFGGLLKAAVSLAIANPDTFFINLGGGGLGGWDDHSGALRDYPGRMRELMGALAVAARHLALMGADHVVINVFGDFGRNVNLNGAGGWDHGNNQNLYTLGGRGIPGRALGKIVGRTVRLGTSFENRQFTGPADGSYQCEPFSIASTVYRYFGVQNPELLTGEPAIDEAAPNEWVA